MLSQWDLFFPLRFLIKEAELISLFPLVAFIIIIIIGCFSPRPLSFLSNINGEFEKLVHVPHTLPRSKTIPIRESWPALPYQLEAHPPFLNKLNHNWGSSVLLLWWFLNNSLLESLFLSISFSFAQLVRVCQSLKGHGYGKWQVANRLYKQLLGLCGRCYWDNGVCYGHAVKAINYACLWCHRLILRTRPLTLYVFLLICTLAPFYHFIPALCVRIRSKYGYLRPRWSFSFSR